MSLEAVFFFMIVLALTVISIREYRDRLGKRVKIFVNYWMRQKASDSV